MDMSEEVTPSSKNIQKDKNISSIKNVQNHLPKKKFYNTVFAKKMRHLRNNKNKLVKLNSNEVLDSCKSLSVDVTRIPSHSVPKVLSSKKPKKKKRGRWQLGIIKKPSNKTVKSIKNDSKDSEEKNYDTCQNLSNHAQTKALQDTPAGSSVNENLNDVVSKSNDSEFIKGASCSCQRTIPFYGKLNTKEARIQNFNKILSENLEVATNKNLKNLLEQEKSNSGISNKISQNKDNSESLQNIIDTNTTRKVNSKKNKASNILKQFDKKTKNLEINEPGKVMKTKDSSKETDAASSNLINSQIKAPKTSAKADSETVPCKEDVLQTPSIKEASTDSIIDVNKKMNSLKPQDTQTNSSEAISTKKEVKNNTEEKSFNSIILKEQKKSCENLNTDVKSVGVPDTEQEIISCRRTEVYHGKLYPQCSRTLPFPELVKNMPERSRVMIPSATTESNNISDKEKIQCSTKNNLNNVIDKDNKLLKSSNDSNSELNDKKNVDEPIHNGEWKFKRKRTNSLDNNQIKETKVNKKSKLLVSSKSTSIKSAVTTPEKKICSLLGSNCQKHSNCQVHQSLEKQYSLKYNLKNAVVLLTDLKHDSSMTKYLKKNSSLIVNETETSSIEIPVNDNLCQVNLTKEKIITKENLSKNIRTAAIEKSEKNELNQHNSPKKNKILESKKNSSDSLNCVISTQEDKEEQQEQSLEEPQQKLQEQPQEQPLQQQQQPQQPQQLEANDSLRKTVPSDESDSTFSFMKRQKKQLKGQGPNSRRKNLRRFLSQDTSESEDEESSSVAQIFKTHQSNNSISSDSVHIPTTRSKSRAAGVFQSFTSSFEEKNTCERSASLVEIPSIDNVDKQNLNLVQNEYDSKQDETDQEMEEISRNIARFRQKQSSSSHSEINNIDEESQESLLSGLQTPPTDNQISNDHLLSPPKTSSNSDDSNLSKVNLTPSKREKDKSKNIDTSINNDLTSPTKMPGNLPLNFSPPKLRNDNVDKNNMVYPCQNLKVQLINLKEICSNYQEYSASEIEKLTENYINLLLNSNFTCKPWVTPINYFKKRSLVNKEMSPTNRFEIETVMEQQEDMGTDNNENMSDHMGEVSDVNSSPTFFALPSESIVLDDNQKNSEKSQNNSSTSPEKATQLPSAQDDFSEKTDLIPDDDGNDKSNKRTEKKTILETKEPIPDNKISSVEQEKSPKNVTATEKNEIESDGKLIISEIDNNSLFSCRFCDKTFISQDFVDQHINSKHSTNSTSVDVDLPIEVNNSDVVSNVSSNLKNQNSESINPIQTPSSDQKKVNKNKKKKKLLPRSNHLNCQMCFISFESKDLLFAHLLTHEESDLRKCLESSKYQLKEKTINSDTNPEKSDEVDKISSLDNSNHDVLKSSAQPKSLNVEEITAVGLSSPTPQSTKDKSTTIEVVHMEVDTESAEVHLNNLNSTSLTVCSCHAAEITNQELQIEMVLLCKSCKILFRRRECFETHYRTSTICSTQRYIVESRIPKLFCSGCPSLIGSLLEMRDHLQMHAKQNIYGTVTFICNICKVVFFGIGTLFYNHWMNHTKSPTFLASRLSFPKLSVVSVLEVAKGAALTTRSQEGFFYVAEHVCVDCKLPFSSELERKKHNCIVASKTNHPESSNSNRALKLKFVCDLCKTSFTSKDHFDKHCIDKRHLKTPITKFSRCQINASEQAFLCSLCNDSSKALDDLIEHWKRMHSPVIEIYRCQTCRIIPPMDPMSCIFDTFKKFEKHSQVHKNTIVTCHVYFANARYVCEICKLGFQTDKLLKDHKTTNHESSIINTGHNKITLYSPFSSIPHTVNSIGASPQSLPQVSLSTTSNVEPSRIAISPNADILDPRGKLQSEGSSTNSPTVETIFLDDSRSNSPSSDNTSSASGSVINNKPSTNKEATQSPGRSVMTMVNPDFEKMLGGRNSINKNDKDGSNLKETDDADIRKNMTATPFEIVLLTDDLSDNPENESGKDVTKESSKTENTAPQEACENSGAKSFLRVRSIAELQCIMCTICNLDFKSRQELELHSQMHKSIPKQQGPPEYRTSTPVQMISPMITHKKPSGDPHNLLIASMRKQIVNKSTGGSPATINSELVRVKTPATLPTLIPLGQNHQNHQPYMFASCNGSTITTSVSSNYNSPQISSHHTNPDLNILRPPVPYSDNPVHTMISGRSSAIQLPEGNIATVLSSNQLTHRPSGAATRIPQKSLSSNFETEYRVQSSNRISQYGTSGPSMSQALSSHPQRVLITQQPIRTYQRPVYPNNIIRVSQPSHSQILQQPPPQQLAPQHQPQAHRFYCDYPNCRFFSDDLQGLRSHQRSHQRNVATSSNQLLPEQQNVQASLSQPTTTDFITENYFLCHVCNCYCLSKNELQEHIKKIHNNSTGQVFCYVCDYCARPLIFDSEALLRKHMDIEHNHFCKLCHKRYPSQTDLKLHLQTKHPHNI